MRAAKDAPEKQTVCVDFDGVLNQYTGWQGPDELFAPTEGALLFLAHLADQFRVVIFTTRYSARVRTWLEQHGMVDYVADITCVKPPALAYIDDRAIRFEGDYGSVLEALGDFKPHWEREEEKAMSTGWLFIPIVGIILWAVKIAYPRLWK